MLPNNGNVIMSAEQAADHSSKTVRVVPTTSLQAGLAALVAFDPLADADDERRRDERGGRGRRDRRGHARVARRPAERRRRCARASGSGSPTASRSRAARRSTRSRAPCSSRLLAEPRGVLTLLTGEEPPALDDAARRARRRASRARARRARGRPAALPAPAGGRVTRSTDSVSLDVAPIRVVLVEDNDTFRETLELLFGMRERDRGRRQRRDRRRGARARAPSSSPTSC